MRTCTDAARQEEEIPAGGGEPKLRILIATATQRVVGGAERYVEQAIEAATARGHRVSLLAEFEGPASRPTPAPDALEAAWIIDRQADAWEQADRWQPDVVFSQGLSSPVHEARLLRMAPTVLAAHGYRGQCVSGSKRLARRNTVCTRRLGTACLLHYFPDRCGGRNPMTMIASWRRERAHQELFGDYSAVVTLSEHMRDACIAHGANPRTTVAIAPAGPRRGEDADAPGAAPVDLTREWRLLFIGRLEPLKGGDLLIDAAALLARERSRPVHVSFVGDGAMRSAWEARAGQACRGTDGLGVTFEGWRGPREQQPPLASAHLLVVPSVWPEPYGLVGIEAARQGIPAVAFPLGGIPEWLVDGVTGRLAALPPSAGSLASAIAGVLDDPAGHARMRAAARAAWETGAEWHFGRVLALLERVARQARAASAPRGMSV